MKSLSSVFLLSCLAITCVHSAPAADTKTNLADYPLSVHVSASTYAAPNLALKNAQFEIVTATIDGKHYQLEGATSGAKFFTGGNGLINPGDYRARLAQDEHKTGYESLQQFDILFPDGTTRRFSVIAQSE